MRLSAAANYLLEAFLQPEDCLLLVQLEVEVEVNDSRAKPNNWASSETGTGTQTGTTTETATTSIIDLLSSSNSLSEGEETSLGSLWNEDDGTEHSSDSAGSSSNYSDGTVGSTKLIDSHVECPSGTLFPTSSSSSSGLLPLGSKPFPTSSSIGATPSSKGSRPTVSSSSGTSVFPCASRSVKRIWNQFMNLIDDNGIGGKVVDSKISSNCGRKMKYTNLDAIIQPVRCSVSR